MEHVLLSDEGKRRRASSLEAEFYLATLVLENWSQVGIGHVAKTRALVEMERGFVHVRGDWWTLEARGPGRSSCPASSKRGRISL